MDERRVINAILIFGVVTLVVATVACLYPSPPSTPRDDWPVLPPPKVLPDQLPVLSDSTRGLISAGRKYPGAHVFDGEHSPYLQRLATEHAKRQARERRQGHGGFPSRASTIYNTLGMSASEICAESWRRQANEPMEEVGTEMFRCWRQSPGHWSVASKKHKAFGADMAKGTNGVWYAAVIVGD
jgi:hypothetical protein